MARHITFKQFSAKFRLLVWIILFGILFVLLEYALFLDISIIEKKNRKTYPKEESKQLETQQFPEYYEDNLRPDWKFRISRNYDSEHLHQWSELIRNVSNWNVTGQGENGVAYIPTKEEEEPMKQLQEEHKYNVWASDKISVRRTLPDYRYPECLNIKYPVILPKTSVIIIFHNERWATLLRTVWSIIDRSPAELLEEIILVDDVSTWEPLKRPLDDYIVLLPASVKIIRTKKREGLIRARLIGAKAAKGSVLTFFDAHIECTDGWLEPILSRISNDRSVVVVPQIDFINTAEMSFDHDENLKFYELKFVLNFEWKEIPSRERLRTKNDPTAPIRTPTHVGCALSVDREFFSEIGSFDEGMNIWGGENIELAFRVWLCGGSLEILPCSIVGHLFRGSTYSWQGDAGLIISQNEKRAAEVWMDEFKEIYYAASLQSRNVSAGDLTDRLELKKRLQCKNFRWYLENIFPESFLLKEFTMVGEFRNAATEKCLHIEGHYIDKCILYDCENGGYNQFFAFIESGEIVTFNEFCVGVDNNTVTVLSCTEKDKSQQWDWNSKEGWIVNREKQLCMQYNGDDIVLGACNSTNTQAKWKFKSNMLLKEK